MRKSARDDGDTGSFSREEHEAGHGPGRGPDLSALPRKGVEADRELLLAQALVEAADTLSEEFKPEAYLRRLADHCVTVVGARGAGFMLADGDGGVVSVADGRDEGASLELLLAQEPDGGPGRDSCGTGHPVDPAHLLDPQVAARWPHFADLAVRHGVTATLAVPLRHGDTLLGALNVFLAAPDHEPDHEDVDGDHDDVDGMALAQILADAAAVGLCNHRDWDQHRMLAEQLQQALNSRVRIEQAKGMLAERWQTGVEAAFIALRGYARSNRLPLADVARAVVERTVDDPALRGHGPRET
ncbi:ANTAR domain protein [Actinobacteria bacterium OK074]|nr:ANTAR domain protein [Actinobacteria bacterium OK074]